MGPTEKGWGNWDEAMRSSWPEGPELLGAGLGAMLGGLSPHLTGQMGRGPGGGKKEGMEGTMRLHRYGIRIPGPERFTQIRVIYVQ